MIKYRTGKKLVHASGGEVSGAGGPMWFRAGIGDGAVQLVDHPGRVLAIVIIPDGGAVGESTTKI